MPDIEVTGAHVEGAEPILTPQALDFVAGLQRRFGARREELLVARTARREEISRTGRLDFLPETAEIRAAEWKVAETPAALLDRRVEITGPTDRK
ncbi:malate synthase A, partial [Streptomyces sp. SID8361]